MRLRVLLAATVTVLAATVASAAPAAATSFRYWTYWHGQGSSWTFSSYGPAARPADGAVEGWRFEVSAATSSTAPPRTAPSFESICGSPSAVDGKKHVALVVDFGSVESRPPGQVPPRGIDTFCAVVPTTANGYQVLSAYSAFTAQAGLICSVAGYPVRECGAPVEPASPSPTVAAPTAPVTSRPAATSTPTPTSRAASTPSVPAATPAAVTPGPTAVPTPAVTTPSARPSVVAVGPAGLPPGTGGPSGGGLPLGAAAGGLLVVGLAVAGLRRARRSP